MECPPEDRRANLIVETLKRKDFVVIKTALPTKNCKALDEHVDTDCSSGSPPDERIPNEIDLRMVLSPEVDTSLEEGPRRWTRIPGMRLNKSSVCKPHDLLQLPELAKEAGLPIIDLFGIWANLWVLVGFDVPH